MTWKYYSVRDAVKIERIYSLFERTFRPDYNFGGEAHDFWEFLYVKSGSICATADGRVHNISAGEIIVHKPFELHKFFITGGESAKLLIFSCSMEGELCEKIKNKVCRLGKRQETVMQAFDEYLHEDAVRRRLRKDGWGDLNWAPLVGEDAAFSQMAVTYISQLVITLSQSDTDSVASTEADAAIFSNAVDYMKSHIDTIPSVWEMANELSISESGLQRVFDKYAKTGVHRYLVSLKMKTATELLRQGVSVCEVARRLGYSSQNYFSAAFKREMGQSPSAMKK